MNPAVAFGIGFLGSFHCLGMCGPIAMAVPFPRSGSGIHFLAVLLYNIGRILTYFAMGVAFGLAGSHLRLAGYQRHLTLTIGMLMLVWALASLFIYKPVTLAYSGIWNFLSPLMSKLMRKRSLVWLPVLGMLNGFLPCGLVYMGLGGSLLTHSVWEGGLFMAMFGLGTLPFMMAVPMLAKRVSNQTRARIRTFYPVIVLVMAGLFIVRGMNLGIPYLSPKIEVVGGIAGGCE